MGIKGWELGWGLSGLCPEPDTQRGTYVGGWPSLAPTVSQCHHRPGKASRAGRTSRRRALEPRRCRPTRNSTSDNTYPHQQKSSRSTEDREPNCRGNQNLPKAGSSPPAGQTPSMPWQPHRVGSSSAAPSSPTSSQHLWPTPHVVERGYASRPAGRERLQAPQKTQDDFRQHGPHGPDRRVALRLQAPLRPG